jgi:hypothetical protein
LGESGEVVEGRWYCRCAEGGEGHNVEASSCDQALIDHCSTDCQADGHSCEPTLEPGTFTCLCDGEGERLEAPGPLCENALEKACVNTNACENAGDRCTRVSGGSTWECECTSYYEATRETSAESCREALEGACSPIGALCNGWNGFCEEGLNDEGDFGYSCTCKDGSSGFLTPEQLGGEDVCSLALEEVCGLGVPDEEYQCIKESPEFDLICTKDQQDGLSGYSCTCAYSCVDGGGATSEFVEADSCRDAIGQINCSGCS